MTSIPDFYDPLTGWRVWAIRGDRLVGMFGYDWPTKGVMEAECRPGSGCETIAKGRKEPDVPHPPLPDDYNVRAHRCGIYALKEPGFALEKMEHWPCHRFAIGEVEFWGRVYEYEHGYRAQHARVKNLLVAEQMFADQPHDADSFTMWAMAFWGGFPTPTHRRWLKQETKEWAERYGVKVLPYKAVKSIGKWKR